MEFLIRKNQYEWRQLSDFSKTLSSASVNDRNDLAIRLSDILRLNWAFTEILMNTSMIDPALEDWSWTVALALFAINQKVDTEFWNS